MVLEAGAFLILKLALFDKSQQSERPVLYHPLRLHAYSPTSQIIKNARGLETDINGHITVPMKKEGKPDIIILLTGASSARSQKPFTNLDETIGGQLQTLFFENKGINAKVVSLATGSYNAFNEFMSMYEYLEEDGNKADYIISVNGLRSIHVFLGKIETRLERGKIYPLYDTKMLEKIRRMQEGEIEIMEVLSLSISNLDSYVIQLLRHISKRFSNKNLPIQKQIKELPNIIKVAESGGVYMQTLALKNNEKRDAAVWNLYNRLVSRESNIFKLMHETSKAHESKITFFLLPAMYSWKNRPVELTKQLNGIFNERSFFQRRFYGDLKKDNTNLKVIDLTTIFDGLQSSENPYNDPSHYNAFGSKIIAQKIFQEISGDIEQIHKMKNSSKVFHGIQQ